MGRKLDMNYVCHGYIYLTGSNRNIERVVYEDVNGKFVVRWYDKWIEVRRRDFNNYTSVEAY